MKPNTPLLSHDVMHIHRQINVHMHYDHLNGVCMLILTSSFLSVTSFCHLSLGSWSRSTVYVGTSVLLREQVSNDSTSTCTCTYMYIHVHIYEAKQFNILVTIIIVSPGDQTHM